MLVDRPALITIREYLDDLLYALVDLRLSFELERTATGFPRFERLEAAVERLDPPHRVLHRLLRLGASVSDADVRSTIPAAVLDAFVETQVLARTPVGHWQTTGCLLVPVDGLLLFVGVPPSYPTASTPCRPWFDLSSFVIARALPTSLAGERVLDVCSGSGVQTLLCAMRGAASVVGLEIDAEAVETARANAVLNALDARVEFRVSNALGALRGNERFDFVVCNTPYAPTLCGAALPASPAQVGNAVLMALLGVLPHHLSPRSRGIVGLWRTIGPGAWTHHRRVVTGQLAEHGFTALAFVDRAPDTLESLMRAVRADLGDRPTTAGDRAAVEAAIRAMLVDAMSPVDGFHNEVITFRRGWAMSAAPGMAFGLTAGTVRPNGQEAVPRTLTSAAGGS